MVEPVLGCRSWPYWGVWGGVLPESKTITRLLGRIEARSTSTTSMISSQRNVFTDGKAKFRGFSAHCFRKDLCREINLTTLRKDRRRGVGGLACYGGPILELRRSSWGTGWLQCSGFQKDLSRVVYI